MARARNIKPGFFTNELLGTYDPIISLLFAGLWCLADKDGILEDRPLRIKAELFPYRDSLDVNGYLTVLERDGFLHRYVVQQKSYIQVCNFAEHQHPHHTERSRGFPSPDKADKALQREQSLTPLNNCDTPSDLLIPDSLIQKEEEHEKHETLTGHPTAGPVLVDQQDHSENPPLAKGSECKAPVNGTAIAFKTFIARCQSCNERPIGDYKPVWDYAGKVGLTEPIVVLAWQEFNRRYNEGGTSDTKRYRDWRKAFLKSLESNWFGLWAIGEDGNAVLTTKGRMAEKATA